MPLHRFHYQENIDTRSPLGQALFTIVSAVAQLERDLIRERVRVGLRNASAKGKKFGRPRAQVDAKKVAALRADGLSWSQVCEESHDKQGNRSAGLLRLAQSPVRIGRAKCLILRNHNAEPGACPQT
ncbi:MAG: recombinase family protein [Candidatus Korobacteraceae bacterium]